MIRSLSRTFSGGLTEVVEIALYAVVLYCRAIKGQSFQNAYLEPTQSYNAVPSQVGFHQEMS